MLRKNSSSKGKLITREQISRGSVKIPNLSTPFGFIPDNFVLKSRPVLVKTLQQIKRITLDLSSQLEQTQPEIQQSFHNSGISILTFPCYIFLTTFNSTHRISSIVLTADDVQKQLEQDLPEISSNILNFFTEEPKLPDNKTPYLNFVKVVEGLSDDQVIKLTAIITHYFRESYSAQQIYTKCLPFISRNAEASENLKIFIKHILQISDDSAEEEEEEKSQPFKRSNLLKSALACAMGEDSLNEIPIKKKLPNYKTPPLIRSEKHGMSYELKETQLPEGFNEQLLFNTKFVSVPSGSEGGNIEGGVDNQLIIDQEEYFKLTQFYPDAQVKISRIEQALSFLKYDDSKVYPGYLVQAIRDLYGQSSWDVFTALKIDWQNTSKILINRFDETIQNFYLTDDIIWRNYLHYENGLIGGQSMTKVPEPNLTLPMTINVQDNLEKLKKLLHLICGIIKTSEISQDIQRSSELFFKIIENVANNETKIRCYMPRIFISAIQLLPAILLAFSEFDKKIHTIVGEEYLFDLKMNLVLSEITDSLQERINSQEITKFFSSNEIPRVMKLLVQCFILRKQQRSLTQFINAAFGSFEGVTLIKRIKLFTSLMHMLVLRGEFEPLVDIFEQYMSGRCSEKLYKKRVRDICPSRGLFAISNHGKGVIRVRHASDGAPMLTVVPVLMIPPPEFNHKKKDN